MKEANGLAVIDPQNWYKRNVFSDYKKTPPKNWIKKYKPLPQENIKEENIEEDIIDSEFELWNDGSPDTKFVSTKKI